MEGPVSAPEKSGGSRPMQPPRFRHPSKTNPRLKTIGLVPSSNFMMRGEGNTDILGFPLVQYTNKCGGQNKKPLILLCIASNHVWHFVSSRQFPKHFYSEKLRWTMKHGLKAHHVSFELISIIPYYFKSKRKQTIVSFSSVPNFYR